MLPPEVAQGFNPRHFRGFREPPLWTPEAARGYRTRLRVTASGVLQLRASVRIDEHRDGRVTGHVVVIDGDERERTGRPFRVTRADLHALLRVADEGRVWSIYPEHWSSSAEDMICVDGIEFVLERVDARGYRFSHANVQCAAPAAFARIAARMFELAREERLQRLLSGAAF
ncbi:MAG TPA: hypothetical protein VGB79_05640 [Allosphingosinicella sp.]|jgi:hypothetical protein